MHTIPGSRIISTNAPGSSRANIDPDDYLVRDPYIHICLACPLDDCICNYSGRPTPGCPRDAQAMAARRSEEPLPGEREAQRRRFTAVRTSQPSPSPAAAGEGAGGEGERPAPHRPEEPLPGERDPQQRRFTAVRTSPVPSAPREEYDQ